MLRSDPIAANKPLARWDWSPPPSLHDCDQIAARLVSSGFGGCVIFSDFEDLVDNDALPRAAQALSSHALESWVAIDLSARRPGEAAPTRAFLRCHEWVTEKGRWLKKRFDRHIVRAFAVDESKAEAHMNIATSIDVTRAINEFVLPRGLKSQSRYRVFAFIEEYRNGCDPLDESTWEAWDRALSSLHDRLMAAGEKLTGMWATIPPLTSEPGNAIIPWHHTLSADFQAAYGYALEEFLPALFADAGVATAKVRQDYWALMRKARWQRLLLHLRDWASSCGISLARMTDPSSLDVFAIELSGEDPVIRVIDNLDCMSVKVAATLDHRSGSNTQRQQTFVLFQSSLSNRSLIERKSIIEDALLSGATRTVHTNHDDLSSLSGDGCESDTAVPPASELISFCQHVSGVGSLLATGRHGTQVALLLPESSIRAHFDPTRKDLLLSCILDDFVYIAGLLVRLKFDYDVIAEDELEDADIRDATLRIGSESFGLLMLPTITTMRTKCWEKIETFVQSGGRVAALGLLPRESERGFDEKISTSVAMMARVDLSSLYETFLHGAQDREVTIDSFPIFREDRSGGRFCTYQPRLCEDQSDATLRVHQILRESITPDFETQTDPILYSRRQISDDENIFAVSNTSFEPVRATLRLRGVGRVDELRTNKDAELRAGQPASSADTFTPVHVYSILDEERVGVPIVLAPREIVAVRLGPPPQIHVETANFTVEHIEISRRAVIVKGYALRSGHNFAEIARPSPSSTRQDDIAGVRESRSHASIEVADSPEIVEITEWNSRLERDNRFCVQSAGFTLSEIANRRVFFEVVCDDPDIQRMVDWINLRVNASSVGQSLFPPYRFDITSLCRGNNEVELISSTLPGTGGWKARVSSYPEIEVVVE